MSSISPLDAAQTGEETDAFQSAIRESRVVSSVMYLSQANATPLSVERAPISEESVA